MKNKEIKKVPVLVAYTKPEMWEAVKQIGSAVQALHGRDADYITFILSGRKDKKGKPLLSAITHYAKVKRIRGKVSMKDYAERAPIIKRLCEEKGWKDDRKGWKDAKEYILEEIKELPKPIFHRKGDPARGQVQFYTTLEELMSANVISDIKTLSQLEKLKKIQK